MEEAVHENDQRRERGWKLFLLLPRLLLFRPARGGDIHKGKLAQRFQDYSEGRWSELLRASTQSAEDASKAQSRKRRHRTVEQELDRRAARALSLVQMGELSSGRQALEGASVAPGTQQTLEALRDPVRRPPVPRDPLPPAVVGHMPDQRFSLEEHRFAANLRSSRRGAAAGLSGMTTDHLRPLLDHVEDTHLFFLMGEQLAQARVPPTIHASIRQGRMIALQKPRGGVRGIVVGDVVRRLVARTMAQQLSKAVEAATAPHQYAMSTRAGTECVAHVLQVLTEMDPQATIVSIDGVGAYDSISRKAMLEALMAVPGGSEALPFVRSFYGQPSRYVWEDELGEVHHINQGEGGEQGDALMPLLFSLGQHAALEAVKARLLPGERLFAFLDDVYVVTLPGRVGSVHNILQEELYRHARIRIHVGKTQVWNAAGDRPPACDVLERIAQVSDPDARVWKGSGVATEQQGIRILGTPLGHPHYVQAFMRKVLAEHEVLLSRIPLVEDVQSRMGSPSALCGRARELHVEGSQA